MSGPLKPEDATWLLERLRLIGVIPAGEDAPAVRQAILDAGIQHNIFGRALPRGVEDYGQRFERVFGEPLVAPSARKRKTNRETLVNRRAG